MAKIVWRFILSNGRLVVALISDRHSPHILKWPLIRIFWLFWERYKSLLIISFLFCKCTQRMQYPYTNANQRLAKIFLITIFYFSSFFFINYMLYSIPYYISLITIPWFQEQTVQTVWLGFLVHWSNCAGLL